MKRRFLAFWVCMAVLLASFTGCYSAQKDVTSVPSSSQTVQSNSGSATENSVEIRTYDIPEENEYYIHRIGRTGRAKRKGVAWSILGNFPEKAKLDEIAKYSHFTIQPMKFDEAGSLVKEQVKQPVVRKKYR